MTGLRLEIRRFQMDLLSLSAEDSIDLEAGYSVQIDRLAENLATFEDWIESAEIAAIDFELELFEVSLKNLRTIYLQIFQKF